MPGVIGGIVDQDPNWTECFGGLADSRVQSGNVGDVAALKKNLYLALAQLRLQRLARFHGHIDKRHLGAGRREGAHDGLANTARAAGDEHRTSKKAGVGSETSFRQLWSDAAKFKSTGRY